jgi:hypothetical protein
MSPCSWPWSFGDRERLEIFCEREKETVSERERKGVAAGEKRREMGRVRSTRPDPCPFK